MKSLLDSIKGPSDLKKLKAEELPLLAEEIRLFIKEFTGVTGGHIGSGLGVVELTIALHYLFELKEQDHLVMDVGHQCYPHKILTGRREDMYSIRQRDGISGFPDPHESPYDRVKTGHGGSSISTAVGMAAGLVNSGADEHQRVLALIGDGGIQEGAALEALNHGGAFDELPLIVILNDNEHGIGPTVGALRKHFSKIRSGSIYRTAKENFKKFVKQIEEQSQFMGRLTYEVVDRMKSSVQHLLPSVNPGELFEALGYLYYGPIDGHDMPTLLESLTICRSMKRPVVLHVITKKGKGYSYKEDRLGYHAGKPSKKITAHLPMEFTRQGGPAYTEIFVEEAMKMAEEDPRVMALTAAMLEGTGLIKFQNKYPNRCFDVGMAEQHAVGMAQGLALAGQKPICAVYSTFMQRSVDQIFQELALINTPVMMCLDRAGVVGPDGATHNGVFDIAYCRMFPNMVVMAPRDGSELRRMMRLGIDYPGPTAIRYPRTNTPLPELELPGSDFNVGESELLIDGTAGCLMAYGALVYPALDAAEVIRERHGLQLAVVNARFAKPIDANTLTKELARQPVVFTLEDHVKAGGFGSAVLEEANALKLDTDKLEIIAIEDHWVDHGQRIEALAMAGLDAPSLVKRIERRLLPQLSTDEPKETMEKAQTETTV